LALDAAGRVRAGEVRLEAPVLLVANPGPDGARPEALGVVAEVLDELLQELVALVGVVDREVARPPAQGLDLAPQDARAHGVEGADPQALDREEDRAARAHLARGLVGEGDR